MALLTGLTPDGLEVPVQVKPDGKLVAEGLTGPAGGAGPQGAAGPVGPKGDDKWKGDVDISYMGGKVGIGTMTPRHPAHVAGAPSISQLYVAAPDLLQPGEFVQIGFGLDFIEYGAIRLSFENPQFIPNTYLGFHVNNGLATEERVRITSSGELGIGTSTPRTLLHAAGTISANDGLEVQSPDGSWWNISVSDAGAVTASRAQVLKR